MCGYPKPTQFSETIVRGMLLMRNNKQLLNPPRRIYDRSLEHPQSHYGQSTHYDTQSSYDFKRPSKSARHAWSKNSTRGRTWSYTYTYTRSGRTYTAHSDDPFSSPFTQRATGRRPSPSQERQQSENDNITKESGVVRFIQVASILAFVMLLSGGGTART
jgi:hypothetical protein